MYGGGGGGGGGNGGGGAMGSSPAGVPTFPFRARWKEVPPAWSQLLHSPTSQKSSKVGRKESPGPPILAGSSATLAVPGSATSLHWKVGVPSQPQRKGALAFPGIGLEGEQVGELHPNSGWDEMLLSNPPPRTSQWKLTTTTSARAQLLPSQHAFSPCAGQTFLPRGVSFCTALLPQKSSSGHHNRVRDSSKNCQIPLSSGSGGSCSCLLPRACCCRRCSSGAVELHV
ncbi:hypothetical protein E2320_017129 [Naja naja]|nr:hypothetical protein E2320_017129 [Naja naja]